MQGHLTSIVLEESSANSTTTPRLFV